MMKVIHGFSLQAIYDAAYLERLGATFEAFGRAPIATLTALGQYGAIDILRDGYRPLLPAQVLLRRALEAQWLRECIPPDRRARTRKPPESLCRHANGDPPRCRAQVVHRDGNDRRDLDPDRLGSQTQSGD